MVLGNKARYAVAILAGVVLISSLLDIDFQEFQWRDALVPLAMFFTLLSMILAIRKSKKDEE